MYRDKQDGYRNMYYIIVLRNNIHKKIYKWMQHHSVEQETIEMEREICIMPLYLDMTYKGVVYISSKFCYSH